MRLFRRFVAPIVQVGRFVHPADRPPAATPESVPCADAPQRPEKPAATPPYRTKWFRWGTGLLGGVATVIAVGALEQLGGELTSITLEWIEGLLG